MDEERQQAYLLAQLNKKRELKQKYLYQSENTVTQNRASGIQSSTLGGLVMANIMLLAIRERKDVFGTINRLRGEAHTSSGGDTLFEAVLDWCGELAETLECGVYEFFIDDRTKRQRIVRSLLKELGQDSRIRWEDIDIDGGSASFRLSDFASYYHMTEQNATDISLVFQKETAPEGRSSYRLMIGDMSRKRPDDLIPDFAVLWEETGGCLQAFMDAEIADLEGGWVLFREDFERRSALLKSEAEKLKDLCAVLKEQPEELNVQGLLRKEQQFLEQLSVEERTAYSHMPQALREGSRGENAKNRMLMIGGAVKSMERASLSQSGQEQADILSEAAYLLEEAGNAVK